MRSIFLISFLLLSLWPATFSQTPPSGNIQVLVVAPAKLGANSNFNLDNLEEYGFDLVIAGTSSTVTQCGWAASLGLLPLEADTLMQEIGTVTPWDALVIMPASWRSGASYADLINNPQILGLFNEADQLGKVIYSTCAGPRVLAAAGILQGVQVTGITQIQSELTAAGAIYLGPDTLPVIDSNIVTSTRGMYYHLENIEAITTALENLPGKKRGGETGSIRQGSLPAITDLMSWSKTFGGPASEGGRAMIRVNGGGYLIAGYTWSEGSGNSDILLIRTDGEGNELWHRTLGGSGWEYGYGVSETNDGGFLVTGYTSTWGNGSKDLLLIRTDQNGQELWYRTFGGADLEVGRAVVETPGGEILLCGYTQSWGNGEDDLLLIKTRADGSLIWQKTFGGVASEMGRDLLINEAGHYMILGSTGSTGAGNRDIWLFETDTAGNQLRSTTFGDSGYQDGYAFIQTTDHGYLISGQSDLHGVDFLDLYAVCTDSALTQKWARRIESPAGFYEYGKDLCETEAGTFLLTGTMKYAQDRSNDVFITELDPQGNTLWTETFGGAASDWASAVCSAGNNDFVVAGHTFSYGSGSSDCWLFKFHLPMTGLQEEKAGKETGMGMPVPNPWKSAVHFMLTIPEGVQATLQIFDPSGLPCRSLKVPGSGKHAMTWDGTNNQGASLPAGIYLLVLKADDQLITRKTLRLEL